MLWKKKSVMVRMLCTFVHAIADIHHLLVVTGQAKAKKKRKPACPKSVNKVRY